MQYEYPTLSKDWHIQILHMKILSTFAHITDLEFKGMSGCEETTIAFFSRDLTVDEKKTLDTLMSQQDAGLYPSSTAGYTVFTIDDILDSWKGLESALGKPIKWMFTNYPDHTKLEIWVEGTLTITDKSKLSNYYATLIKEKV